MWRTVKVKMITLTLDDDEYWDTDEIEAEMKNGGSDSIDGTPDNDDYGLLRGGSGIVCR